MTKSVFGVAVAALMIASPASAQILGGGGGGGPLGGGGGPLGGSIGGTIGGSIDRGRIPVDTVTRTRTDIRSDRDLRPRRGDRPIATRVRGDSTLDSATRIGERQIVARGSTSADSRLTLDQQMLRTRGSVGATRRGLRRVRPTSAGVSVFVPQVAVAAPSVPVRVTATSYPAYGAGYYYGPGAVFVSSGYVDVYMDRQYRELEDSLAGTGATFRRRGADLVVILPADVTFAFDRTDIRSQFTARLDDFAQTLNSYPGTDVEVIGHTDSAGSETYNIGLSERRGRSVADFLVARGVSPVRLVVEAMGESQPVATNASVEGRAANRRVEFIIHPRSG